MPDQSNTKPEPWLDRFAEDASGHSVSSAGTVPEEVQTPGVAAVAAGFGFPRHDPDHYLTQPMDNQEAVLLREIAALRAENEKLKIKLSRMCCDA